MTEKNGQIAMHKYCSYPAMIKAPRCQNNLKKKKKKKKNKKKKKKN